MITPEKNCWLVVNYFLDYLAEAVIANCIGEIPCLSTRWVRSLNTAHKLSNIEKKKNLSRAGIQTLGCRVRSANATSVLWRPLVVVNYLVFQVFRPLDALKLK